MADAGRLAELPGGAGGGVGYLDAEGVELVPDLVGPGPVLLLAGQGLLGEPPLRLTSIAFPADSVLEPGEWTALKRCLGMRVDPESFRFSATDEIEGPNSRLRIRSAGDR